MLGIFSKGPCDNLGISLAGGLGSPHGNIFLFIATMDTDGLAAKTQDLQVSSDYIPVCFSHHISEDTFL